MSRFIGLGGAAVRWTVLLLLTMTGCLNQPLPPPPPPATAIPLPTAQPTVLRNIGQNDLTAAAVPSGGALPPLEMPGQTVDAAAQTVAITLGDGVLAVGELYPNPGGTRVPGVLLLAGQRTVWRDLPLRLQGAGYTVLSVDVRAGAAVMGDLITLLDALTEVSTVDPGRIAVLGVAAGADAALAGCAADLRCDALALIGLTAAAQPDTIVQYNPRPLLLIHGTDADAAAVAGQIRADARGAVRYEAVAGNADGAALLEQQPALVDVLIEWLGVLRG